jgi:RimJ/RimL family protein N-acetyltransferase
LRWIAGHAAAASSGEAWEWALVDAATNALAGRRALKSITWTQGRASAACWVAPAYRGRQFAARSLRLAAAHAFAQGLVRVQAECEADNAASLRSVRSAGMRHEGRLRSFFVSNAGAHVDAEMYSLLADDLENAPAFRSSSRAAPATLPASHSLANAVDVRAPSIQSSRIEAREVQPAIAPGRTWCRVDDPANLPLDGTLVPSSKHWVV